MLIIIGGYGERGPFPRKYAMKKRVGNYRICKIDSSAYKYNRELKTIMGKKIQALQLEIKCGISYSEQKRETKKILNISGHEKKKKLVYFFPCPHIYFFPLFSSSFSFFLFFFLSATFSARLCLVFFE